MLAQKLLSKSVPFVFFPQRQRSDLVESLGQGTRWQRCDLLLIQLLGSRPNGVAPPILESKEVGQQVVAEGVRCLPWEKRRKMIDANHIQRWSLQTLDVDCGLVEGRCDRVDRYCEVS